MENKGRATASVLTVLLLVLSALLPILVVPTAAAVTTGTSGTAGSFEQSGVFVVRGEAPPTLADLTFDNNTSPANQLADLATSLHDNPLQIFLFVRNSIYFDPYEGSMKGAYQTYSTLAGNDIDQASLLISLLRLANIPARYVVGNITLPEQEVENWLGFSPAMTNSSSQNVTIAGQLAQVFSDAGISEKYRCGNDACTYDTFDISHVWVEAYLNGTWVQMDPSFKQYVYYPPVDWSSVYKIDTASAFNSSASNAYQLTNYLTGVMEDYMLHASNLKVGNVFGGNQIVNESTFSLPLSIAANFTTPTLPSTLDWRLGVTFPSYDSSSGSFSFGKNYSVTIPTALLWQSPLSVYSLPDNATLNYVRSFPNGVFDPSIDLTEVSMKPCLLFDGKNLIEGDVAPFGHSMSVSVSTTVNSEIVLTGMTTYTIGEYDALITSLGHNWGTGDELLSNALQTYNSTALAWLAGQRVSLDNLIGQWSLVAGTSYFYLCNALSGILASYREIVEVKDVSVALVGQQLAVYSSGSPAPRLAPGGLFIDEFMNGKFDGIQVLANSVLQRDFNLIEGFVGSYLEGLVIGTLTESAPISTVSVLAYAQQQGIPIVIMSPQNFTQVSSTLNLPSWAISQLSLWIEQGAWIETPSSLVVTEGIRIEASTSEVSQGLASAWNGFAFIEFDPETYSAGYFISGSTISGSEASAIRTIQGGAQGISSGVSRLWGQITNWAGTLTGGSGESAQIPPAQGASDRATLVSQIMAAYGCDQDTAELMVDTHGPGVSYSARQATNAGNGLSDVKDAFMQPISGVPTSVTDAPGIAGAYGTAGAFYKGANDFSATWNKEMPPSGKQPPSPCGGPCYSPRPIQQNSTIQMYLTDSYGDRSGLQLGNSNLIPFTQYYNANVTDSQLFLYEIPPGSYDLSLANPSSSAVSALGSLQMISGPNTSQIEFGPVNIGPYQTVSTNCTVAYSGNKMVVELGGFQPASFLVLNPTNTLVWHGNASISGKLTIGNSTNALPSEPLAVSYRPSGSLDDWVMLGTTTTSSDGTFTFNWEVENISAPPLGRVDLRVNFAPNASDYPSSATVTTYVTTHLSVSALSSSQRPIPGLNITVAEAPGVLISNITQSNGKASFLVPETSYQVQLPASNQLASGSRVLFSRWSDGTTATNRTVNLNAPIELSGFFDLQYLATAGYTVLGGGTPPAPTLTGVSSGSRTTCFLNETSDQVWLDNGSQWSTPALLSGTAFERWITSNTTNGTVSAAFTLTISYQHQYYVGTRATTGGLVSLSSGWYDAGQMLQISASPDAGWKLGIWNALGAGSYAGGSNSATLTVNGPINQTAVFYPGLTIQVSGSGSVQYSYGDILGTVNSGNMTIYVPPGANVQLSASPSFLLYQFNGWAGATTSKSGAVSLSLDSPLSAQAVFAFDYLNLSIIAVIAIATLLIGSMAVMRRTRGGSGPKAPSTATQAAPASPPVLPKAAGPQPRDLLCPTCHNPIVRGEPFCPTCGTKLGSGQNFCRRCGHPVSPQALFCNQCGNRLS